MNKNSAKVAIIVVCLIAAGAALLYNLGMFDSAPETTGTTVDSAETAAEANRAQTDPNAPVSVGGLTRDPH